MLKISIADNTNIDKVYALRNEVFVIEQQVDPTIERDERDKEATHIVATMDNLVVGCARLFWEDGAHIGRFAVAKEYRNKGVGRAICQYIIDLAKERNCHQVWLNAQLVSYDFYLKIGFTPVGDVFYEANMAHVKMVGALHPAMACK
ncbi:MAG: GNAT family N-acetyltransferase [Clostridia bacterium]|nr:GNAT family N-acetyltransferase [Clostridia bacterium]